MSYKTTLLEWDSNFFGYRIGKIVLPDGNIDDVSLKNAISGSVVDLVFVYCAKSHASNVSSLLNPSFVENKVTFSVPITHEMGNIGVTLDRVSDFGRLNEVYYLALESGKFSRFRLDPKMNHFEFEKLYFEWIFKSIPGKFDQDVFVYTQDDKPLGLVTLKTNGDTATIGLIASHPHYQGQGIGQKMIQFSKGYALQKKCKFLSVATQETNAAAMKFYDKNGFSIKSIDCILHAWKPGFL